MHDILLLIHLVGLMLGAGGGFGSMIAMRRALAAPPGQAGVLRGLGPHYANMSALGLAAMWGSGVIMAVTEIGIPNLPTLFWVKMIFVSTLTLAAILMHMTYGQIRRGDMAAAKRLPVLGPMAGISSLLAVAFAVFAFH